MTTGELVIRVVALLVGIAAISAMTVLAFTLAQHTAALERNTLATNNRLIGFDENGSGAYLITKSGNWNLVRQGNAILTTVDTDIAAEMMVKKTFAPHLTGYDTTVLGVGGRIEIPLEVQASGSKMWPSRGYVTPSLSISAGGANYSQLVLVRRYGTGANDFVNLGSTNWDANALTGGVAIELTGSGFKSDAQIFSPGNVLALQIRKQGTGSVLLPATTTGGGWLSIEFHALPFTDTPSFMGE